LKGNIMPFNQVKIPVYSAYYNQNWTPLALGMIVSFAKTYQGGVLCQDFEFVPGVIGTEEELKAAFQKYGPGVFLFSGYIWNIHRSLAFSKLAKELSRDSITIHGGPSVPAYIKPCQDFFEQHPHVDITVRAEGEVTTCELLTELALNKRRA